MKKIFFLLGLAITIVPIISRAQSGVYNLNGKIGHLSSPYKVYLKYVDHDGLKIDSSVLDNGAFKLSGTFKYPKLGYLQVGTSANDYNSATLECCIENGNINIVSPDSLQNAVINGGPANNDFNHWRKISADMDKRQLKISQEYSLAKENKQQHAMDSLSDTRKALLAQERSARKDFIKDHPNSWASFILIKDMGGQLPDADEIEPLLSAISPQIRTSEEGKKYVTYVQQFESSSTGAIAPDFTAMDTVGRPISLHDFKGKYVLVDFWASWCGPCRAENPNVARNYAAYKDQNFTIIGISLDDASAKSAWIKAIKDDKVTWKQVSELKGFDAAVAIKYNITAIPQNFLVDPSGKIIARNLRGDELHDKLSALFDKK